MRSTITIRVAEPADAPALADLHIRSAQKGFRHIFPADPLAPRKDELTDDWIAWLWSDPSLAREATVVERSGSIVGVIVAGRDQSDPTVGRLTRAYIDPQVWGSRVAQLMFNAAIDHLPTSDLDSMQPFGQDSRENGDHLDERHRRRSEAWRGSAASLPVTPSL